MDGTQQIVVEAANKSFRNNTNSDFSVRLPEPLNFDSVYELALLDVSIPCTVHNVKNENYFDLVFYGKTVGSGHASDRKRRTVRNGLNMNTLPAYPPEKKKNLNPAGDSNGLGGGGPGIPLKKRGRAVPDPSENATVKRLKPSAPSETGASTDDRVGKATYTARGCVRLSIPPGYYENTKTLITVITNRGVDLIERGWNTVNFPLTWLNVAEPSLLNSAKAVDEKCIKESNPPGVYMFGKADGSLFKSGLKLKGYVLKLFKKSLGRLRYSNRSGLLRISPLERGGIPVSCHYSSDVGFLLGHPTKRYFRLPSTARKWASSPFLCRVQPASVIYIYCDQVTHSIVNNLRTNILKCVPFSSRKLEFGDVFHQTFLRPTFTPINTMSLHQLCFALRGYDGKKLGFQDSTQSVRLTLQIRKRLNRRDDM